jgi:ubiquitin-conjugating enzyme E2 T
MEPPHVKFITKVFHPNVDDQGRICLDVLKMPPKGTWNPSLTVLAVLKCIQLLLVEPNPDDPLDVEIVSVYD